MKLDLRDPDVRRQVQAFVAGGQLDRLSPYELNQLYQDLDAYDRALKVESAQSSLIQFCCWMNPDYKPGKIHYMIAENLEAVCSGDLLRLAVSMPPRAGKSMLISEYFPAYYLGHHADHKLLAASNNTDLAEGFGRKVRNHIDSNDFQQLFNKTNISKDSSSAGRWSTLAGGEAYYTGVGGALAGRGAHLAILDDPFSEQDILTGTDNIYGKVYDWYLSGPRQRLMPNGRIVIVHTRWSRSDLIARVIEDGQSNPGADQYTYMELPAILPSGESFWPEMWPADQLLRVKATMEARGKKYLWDAQYQQRPTGAGQTFVKEEMFKRWEKKDPPPCDYIILSLDAAVEATKRSDYNVFLTLGVFTDENIIDTDTLEPVPQVIVLDMIRERMEFPQLKRKARECLDDYTPDVFLIEKKANGAPLLHEMRQSGLGVQPFDPGTQDKAVRFSTVVDIIASGLVWVPIDFSWAQVFLDEVCGFPNEPHDDCCLVAGTEILLPDGGFCAIELLNVGDYVATPLGPRKVIAAGLTGTRPVFEVWVGPRRLEITDNHPIATTRGWLDLKQISAYTNVSIVTGDTSWQVNEIPTWLLNALSLTAGNIDATPSQKTRRIDATLAGQVLSCIAMCGSSTMAQYLKDTKFTTKTKTQATTGSRIWSAFRSSGTKRFTGRQRLRWGALLSNYNIWIKRAWKQANGTLPLKVLNGIGSMLSSKIWGRVRQHVWPPAPLLPYGATTAAKSSSHQEHASTTAARSAKERPPENEKSNATPSARIPVSSVESRSRINGRPSNIALSTATLSSITPNGEQPVYNITVEGAHCYFANGVLVHNCDALVQALIYIRRGGYVGIPSDAKDDPDSNWFKRKKVVGYGAR